ncbi:MAG: cupin domain-containing protein [Thermoplasmata archaeon]
MLPEGIIELNDMIEVQSEAMVSRTLIQGNGGTVTLFAFDEEQSLSEHTTPFDAMVQIIKGNMEVVLRGEEHSIEAGRCIIMPANVPHSLKALEPSKMLLTMIR